MAASARNSSLRIFVTGVRWTTSRNDIRQHFSKYGTVEDVYQPINLFTGYPLFHGVYVTMATPECVANILKQRVHTIEGKNVYIQRQDRRQFSRDDMDSLQESQEKEHV